MSSMPSTREELLAVLRMALPGVALSTDSLDRFSSDIFYQSTHTPLAVVTPKSAAEIAEIVKVCRQNQIVLNILGAGLSYSAGYLPQSERTLTLDLSAMTKIIEVNARDRYVTVEPGVTWAALRDHLKPLGLTTPFWGTFSGRHATIGGSVSQGAKFFGSASRGGSAESVLGLEVVTGTGERLVTGSAAGTGQSSPFFRNYGPDLSGLFLGDCGAFGIKVAITLQLIPRPPAEAFCSFSFDDPAALMSVMGQIGSELLATECLGMDPFSARMRMAGEGLKSDLATLAKVVRGNESVVTGMREAAMIALHGRRFTDRIGYLMNCIVEGRNRNDARSRIRRIRQIARDAGGTSVPPSVPRVMRSVPFPEMNTLLTGSGKRMNWLHTVVPNSRGQACFEATEAVFSRHAQAMASHKIDRGYLLSTHGPSGVGIETLIRWPDAPLPLHLKHMSDTQRREQKTRSANPEARAALDALSRDIVACWRDLGGVHMQIGRKYPYFESRQPNTQEMLRKLKAICDPDAILNPGVVLPVEPGHHAAEPVPASGSPREAPAPNVP